MREAKERSYWEKVTKHTISDFYPVTETFHFQNDGDPSNLEIEEEL